MFFRVFLLFALVALAFASPKPDPQVVAYSAPGVLPYAYSSYTPVAYSAQYAGYPYAYSAYPYYYR